MGKMNRTSAELTANGSRGRYWAAKRRAEKREKLIESNATMIRPILKSAPYEPKTYLIKKETKE